MPSKVGNVTQPVVPRRLRRILCLDDFEPAAKARLPRPLFGYVAGAAETNASAEWQSSRVRQVSFRAACDDQHRRSQHGNHAAFAAIQRSVQDAPLGLAALMAYRGDLVLAKAAATAGIPMIMSGSSLIPLEEVATAYPQAWSTPICRVSRRQSPRLSSGSSGQGFRHLSSLSTHQWLQIGKITYVPDFPHHFGLLSD